MNELPSQTSSQVNKREVDRTGLQEASSIKVAGVYAPQSQGATPPPPTQKSYADPSAQSRADKLVLVLSEIENLPLWVQQVIYADLKRHLDADNMMNPLNTYKKEDFLQLWKPNLTEYGLMALMRHNVEDSDDSRLLLEACRHHDSVAMMCARYEWSLQNACQLIVQALRQKYLECPESKILEASVRYLGDEIRIGEFLVFVGRVDQKQMEMALQTQQYIESAMGERSKIADILIRLELVTPSDVESILFLKEESCKPFRLF